MGRHFASTVHVLGDDGAYHVFGPSDEVPDWAAGRVGDHVWAVEEPPRSGAGSGKAAWADFASAKGVEVSEEDDKDAIIAKLAAAGVVSN